MHWLFLCWNHFGSRTQWKMKDNTSFSLFFGRCAEWTEEKAAYQHKYTLFRLIFFLHIRQACKQFWFVCSARVHANPKQYQIRTNYTHLFSFAVVRRWVSISFEPALQCFGEHVLRWKTFCLHDNNQFDDHLCTQRRIVRVLSGACLCDWMWRSSSI